LLTSVTKKVECYQYGTWSLREWSALKCLNLWAGLVVIIAVKSFTVRAQGSQGSGFPCLDPDNEGTHRDLRVLDTPTSNPFFNDKNFTFIDKKTRISYRNHAWLKTTPGADPIKLLGVEPLKGVPL
jgi:hypothetical protein